MMMEDVCVTNNMYYESKYYYQQKYERFYFFFIGSFNPQHKCEITYKGKIYNCAEQYVMQQKALLFKDKETAKKIMKSKNPLEQKYLGTTIKNFVRHKWEEERTRIMEEITLAKFTQDKNLRDELFTTNLTQIVMANKYDLEWGIGLWYWENKAKDRRTWCGKNLLGQVLTYVRDALITPSTVS